MDDIELDQLFPGYPNVANGVRTMKRQWEKEQHTVKKKGGGTDLSLPFIIAKGPNVGRVAFRVRTAIEGKKPEVVIYSGEKDLRRGSPLLKGADESDRQKLKNLCFNRVKAGWRMSLSEKTEPDFYNKF